VKYARTIDAEQPPLDYPAYGSTQLRHPAKALLVISHPVSETTQPVDAEGWYAIRTRRPGPDRTGQAPHLAMSVLVEGLLDRVVTRVNFADEETANATDPVLAAAGDRAATLVAKPRGGRLSLRHPVAGRR